MAVKVSVDIKAKVATYQHKTLAALPGIALDMADMPTHSGLQTEIALIGYVVGQKSGKAEYDFNNQIFVPYCLRYYGEGKGLQRKPLKGFSNDGKHVDKSSAETLLRGYLHFYAAGKTGLDCVPVIRSLMEAGGEFAKKGIAAKGAALSKLLLEAKGKVPSKDAVTALIDKANEGGTGNKPNPVVTAAKAMRSRVKELAENAEFKAALTAALAVQFKEVADNVVMFAQTAIGQKSGKPGETEAKTNGDILALVASLATPATPEKAPRRRRAAAA